MPQTHAELVEAAAESLRAAGIEATTEAYARLGSMTFEGLRFFGLSIAQAFHAGYTAGETRGQLAMAYAAQRMEVPQ